MATRVVWAQIVQLARSNDKTADTMVSGRHLNTARHVAGWLYNCWRVEVSRVLRYEIRVEQDNRVREELVEAPPVASTDIVTTLSSFN